MNDAQRPMPKNCVIAFDNCQYDWRAKYKRKKKRIRKKHYFFVHIHVSANCSFVRPAIRSSIESNFLNWKCLWFRIGYSISNHVLIAWTFFIERNRRRWRRKCAHQRWLYRRWVRVDRRIVMVRQCGTINGAWAPFANRSNRSFMNKIKKKKQVPGQVWDISLIEKKPVALKRNHTKSHSHF